MKSLRHFFVEVPEKTTGTVTVGGKELYIDTRFNEFEHRVCHGKVLSAPNSFETGVKKGDTLFFHHHVTISDNLRIDDGVYMAVLDYANPRGSHAIAYRKSNGELHMLADWVFLEPIESSTEEEVTEGGVIIVSHEEKKRGRGSGRYPIETDGRTRCKERRRGWLLTRPRLQNETG